MASRPRRPYIRAKQKERITATRRKQSSPSKRSEPRVWWSSSSVFVAAAVAGAASAIAGALTAIQVPSPGSNSPRTPSNVNLNIFDSSLLPYLLIALAIVIGVTLASLIYSLIQVRNRRATLKEIQELEKRYAEDVLDLKEIWTVTQKRLDYYHDIATSQSRQSFISTQVSTGLGFILIVVVGWIAAQSTSLVGTISAGAVGVVGGGLSAFIGATFMKTQAGATAQLRQFFLQPVEHSRLLAAERLIENLEPEQKAIATQEIIKAMMQVQLDKSKDEA